LAQDTGRGDDIEEQEEYESINSDESFKYEELNKKTSNRQSIFDSKAETMLVRSNTITFL